MPGLETEGRSKGQQPRRGMPHTDSRRVPVVLLGIFLSMPLMVYYVFGEGVRFYKIPIGSLGCTLISLHLLLGRRLRFHWESSCVPKLICAFITISLVSVLLGLLRYLHFSGLLSFSYQLITMSYFVVGFSLLREGDDFLRLARAIVITTALCSLPLVVYIFRSGSYTDIFALHNDVALRSTIFGWPNAYGCFLAIALMFALLASSVSMTQKESLFYMACAIVLGTGVVLTFSRSAYAMCALAFLSWLLRKKGLLRKILILGLVASLMCSIFLFFPDVPDLLWYTGTVEVRLAFLELVLQDLAVFDLIAGHGYQSLFVIMRDRSGEVVVPGLTFDDMSTHDEYLTMLLKSGVFGLAIFLAILFMVTKYTYQLSVRYPDSRIRYVFACWHCVLIPLLLTLFVMENLRYWPIAVIFWMFSGSALNFLKARTQRVVNQATGELVPELGASSGRVAGEAFLLR